MAPRHDVTRRTFIRAGSAAAAGALAAAHVPRLFAQAAFDLVIRGGFVVDGTGTAPFAADIGLAGDRIAAIGRISPEQARRVIDAAGLHVAPGFIDIHTHSDGDILIYPTADSRVRQGVTTEVTGNCGSSSAPLSGADVERTRREWREQNIEAAWSGMASYCDAINRAGISVNHAQLVGQGTLRQNAIGLVDRPLTAAELEAVCRAVDEAMVEGAWGLSTGLEYVPGRYTPTDEIVAMSRVVARHGGFYASHIRNEEAQVLEAVDEAISIGRRTGCRVGHPARARERRTGGRSGGAHRGEARPRPAALVERCPARRQDQDVAAVRAKLPGRSLRLIRKWPSTTFARSFAMRFVACVALPASPPSPS
jgi:N-acyl-D-aspartate/D-glutamate deacylase